MNIVEWKDKARRIIRIGPDEEVWEEILDALLYASEIGGLPLLDKLVDDDC